MTAHAGDLALARAIVAGDEDALAELYRLYYARLYRFAYYQVGRSHEDVQDVMQETLIAAVAHMGEYRGESSLYTWLCGIAWHKAADLRRREYRQAQIERRTMLAYEAPETEHEHTVCEREVARAGLRRAMRGLYPGWGRALVLRYCHDLSVEELARRMGRGGYKATESMLTRARAALRQAYEEAV